MGDGGQKAGDPSPKAVFDVAAGNEASAANLDAGTAVEDTKITGSALQKLAADPSQQEKGKVVDAHPKSSSPSRSPSRERKRRSRSRSRSRTRRSRSPRDRRRRSDRRSDRRRSRSNSPRSRRDRDRGDRERRRSRSPRGDRRRRYRSRSRSRDNRRRRRRSPSSSRSPSRSHGRGHAAAYPPGGTAAAVAASLFPNMLPSGMNPMTATMPNMPNLHTVQMQNMAAAVGAMAGIAVPGQPGMPIPLQATRTQRRLYVGGIPNPCFDFQLIEFLGSTLIALGLVANSGRLPIYKAEITQERSFAFVEFWDVADCTSCMQLDGIIYNGQALKIKRPRDYVMPYGSFDPPPLGPVAIATLLAQKTGTHPPPGLLSVGGMPSVSPGGGVNGGAV